MVREIPTREVTEYQSIDGEWYPTREAARNADARHAISEICHEHGWQGVVTANDVATFIIHNLSALAPWLDDLNA